jgi:hypothetical protein
VPNREGAMADRRDVASLRELLDHYRLVFEKWS